MTDQPPKVLFYIPEDSTSQMDGPMADALNIAKSFKLANIPSIFVLNGHPDKFQKFIETGADVRRLDMPLPGFRHHISFSYRRKFSQQLAELIKTENIDVLHLGSRANYVLNYLKTQSILKVCTQAGGTPDPEPLKMINSWIFNPKRLLKRWYYKYVTWNFKHADLVICPSETARQTAIITCNVKPEKTVVIRPHAASQLETSKTGQIRKEFDVNNDEKIVLSVGRITKAKGVEDVGKVAKILFARGKKFRFLFAGYERDMDYALRVREKYGKYITFIGHRQDVANAFADADMLLHLSHREGSPLAIIESLEFGLPCIAWDIPGVNEDVHDGLTGKVSPFGNHKHVADSIQSILENPVELHRLSNGANIKFSDHSISDYAGKILSAYKCRKSDQLRHSKPTFL
ncbi:MAG: glycosyltransferase family 4 protein [Chloroflexota bacterium]|nr:glycosyltransferase family 4 protein [Chloroflexota bacterium]